MHNTSFVSQVSARARAGCTAQLGARLGALIEPASSAPGCVQFSLQQSMTEESVWVATGLWKGEQAMNDWFATPDLNIFTDLLADSLIISLDFQTFVHFTASQVAAAGQMADARMAG